MPLQERRSERSRTVCSCNYRIVKSKCHSKCPLVMVGANSNHGSLPWQEFAPATIERPLHGALRQVMVGAYFDLQILILVLQLSNRTPTMAACRGRSAAVSGAELFAPATCMMLRWSLSRTVCSCNYRISLLRSSPPGPLLSGQNRNRKAFQVEYV